jgi:hypothetical protein
MKRRYFLLGSAAAAHSAFGQNAAARIPTAMIGAGNRGSFVLKGVLEQPNSKVVALCDLKPSRLDAAASSAAKDNPATYTDWRKIIDRKDIEAPEHAPEPAPASSWAPKVIILKLRNPENSRLQTEPGAIPHPPLTMCA